MPRGVPDLQFSSAPRDDVPTRTAKVMVYLPREQVDHLDQLLITARRQLGRSVTRSKLIELCIAATGDDEILGALEAGS